MKMSELVTALTALRISHNSTVLLDCLSLAELMRATGGTGPFSTEQLMTAFGTASANAVSRHLAKLRDAGLLDADRYGREGLTVNRIGP
jgi:DNA-binding transcriptional ArsR family regulator